MRPLADLAGGAATHRLRSVRAVLAVAAYRVGDLAFALGDRLDPDDVYRRATELWLECIERDRRVRLRDYLDHPALRDDL